MKSRLYRGYVRHTRLIPTHHRFEYPFYFYGFDLAELFRLDRRLPLFGYNRLRPAGIHDADYLEQKSGSIQEKLMGLLARQGLADRVSDVFLITAARYFHYVFNPVSFYYCFTDQQKLCCVVAEVNNTFGERHLYILDQLESRVDGFMARAGAQKTFHVSPFNNMQGTYDFFLSGVEQEVDIRIHLSRHDETVLKTQLWGEPVELNARNHLKMLATHPLIPHLTIPRIYRQALQLHFGKKLPIHPKPVPTHPMTIRKNPPTIFQKRCLSYIVHLFHSISTGCLRMHLPDGREMIFGDRDALRQAEIRVHDYRFFSRLVLNGDVGLGEAYMYSEWDSADVPEVVGLLIENREILSHGNLSTAWISRLFRYYRWLRQKNHIVGTRRNIRRHYDLSNDFFQTFLDSSMTYSCALFKHPADSLEEAQRHKIHAIIDKARISRRDHVLEIGCGWGAMAIETVRKTGCRYTGITVSRKQYELATERVKAAGLADHIDIRLQDYRELTDRFDRIVSVEMLEAVGHQYFSDFYQACERLLNPDGLIVLQVITIPDHYYDTYRRESDWIRKHIFPGGLLPSLTVLCDNMARCSTLVVESIENIGIHYAATLKKWRERFLQHKDRVRRLGFDRTFRRKWLYYFSCCEATFATRYLSTLQMVLTRPGNSLPDDSHRCPLVSQQQ
jgi:cyclopropane-fatty-acyl-phospholipid synthase